MKKNLKSTISWHCPYLKKIFSREYFFWRPVKLSMCFLHVRWWFPKFFVDLQLKKLNSKFLLVSMKLYTTVNSKTLGSNFEPENIHNSICWSMPNRAIRPRYAFSGQHLWNKRIGTNGKGTISHCVRRTWVSMVTTTLLPTGWESLALEKTTKTGTK